MSRWQPFTDDELILLAESVVLAHEPGGFESTPDSDDLGVLIDLVSELVDRDTDTSAVASLQALIRRASAED